ncbi:MAG TPA: MATE family efflux transporter [Rhizomicrobium sp.]|nr:MATE family efflux transporter [Rhizomicrobium sp.]
MSKMSNLDLGQSGPRISGNQRGALWLEMKALTRLAAPLAATQLAQMVILATDTLMLGHLSKEALAAATLANQVYIMTWLVGLGPASAVPAMIAHIRGARESNWGGVRHIVRMGLWSVALLSVPLLLLLTFTRDILLLLGQDALLADHAAAFMTALMWGLPFSLAYQVLRNFSTAVDKPMMPLIVAGLTVMVNAVVGYGLIFGHFGLPRLELMGSGLASAFANFFGFAAMLAFVMLQPKLRRYRVLHRWAQPHWAHLREVFHLGMPIGVTMMFEVALFVTAAFTMGLFGADILAAHQIAITVPSLTFMVPLGIGMAATVRVGLAKGAGDAVEARRAGFAAMGMAVVFMTFTSVLLLSFPRVIAGLWLPDIPANAAVLSLAVSFLMVGAAFQLVDGLQVTAALSLRGLKDAQAPMWIAGASYWLCGFPVCLWLGFGLKMQGLGVWIGLAFGLLVAAVALIWRFNRLSKVTAAQIQQQEE